MTDSRLHGALLVVVLLLLTGCNGLLGPGGTPTPSKSTLGTPAESIDVPGLTEAGVQNATELGRAHDRELREQPVTIVETTTVTYPNGSTRGQATAVTRLDPSNTALRRVNLSGTATTAGVVSETAWSNDTVRVFRWERSNGSVTYDVRSGDVYYQVSPGSVFAKSLGNESLEVVGTRQVDGNRTAHVLETRNPDMAAWGPSQEFRNTSMRVVVTESGLFRSVTLRFEERGGTFGVGPSDDQGRTDEFVPVTWTVQVRDVGSTTVPRPTWVDRGMNRTSGSGP